MPLIEQRNAPLSKSAALSDILNWSLKRPRWQRDALRRLIVHGVLTDDDFDALYELCLNKEAKFEPLSWDHVSHAEDAGVSIVLKCIREPDGINTLAEDQSLDFGQTGLTLVYGDNGSGKSSYCRILKHACRSRDTSFKILRDIDEDQNIQQGAKIAFKRGDEDDQTMWSPDSVGHKDLQAISVFDSKSANTHVQKTNDVAYIPYPMHLLEQLASACDIIKERINEEITALKQKTLRAISEPQLNEQTEAGNFLHNLNSKSKITELNRLTKLTEDEEAWFAMLQTDLFSDPKKALARLRSQHTTIVEQVKLLHILVETTSMNKVSELNTLKKEKDRMQALAKTVSEELFESPSLPDIGGDLWKSLWTAARTYAEGKAYIKKSFPNDLSEEDLCVLCQQPLGPDAVKRFLTFERFIKNTTSADAERACIAYNQAECKLADARISVLGFGRFIRTISHEMDRPALADSLRRTGVIGLWRLRAMLREKSPDAPATPLDDQVLNNALESFIKRMKQLNADENSETRITMRTDYQELRDRIMLRELKADIEVELKRIKQQTVLSQALKQVNKKSITIKNKNLSDKLVTDALRDRFAREVEKLKIGAMPIELVKKHDRSARSYFRVQIVDHPDVAIGEILSEGEYRCVALAAFLAELVTSTEKSGIVFDDPISSLDHLYRRRVARRLVEEAAYRQVIVFTHDLTFLFEINRQADELGYPIHYRTVQRKKRRTGYIEKDLPLKGKELGLKVNAIEAQLKSIKGQFDNWPEDERITIVGGVISRLRIAWELAIAEFLRPVLTRFDSHVKPNSLYKLLVLTKEDVHKVTEAFSRLSTDLHASSETLNRAEVKHEDLVKETRLLKEWIDNWRKRQKNAPRA